VVAAQVRTLVEVRTGKTAAVTEDAAVEDELRWPGMDAVDFTIVDALQDDGRASLLGISRQLGIPVGAVRQRYERLVGSGYIRSVALVDPGTVGRHVVAFVEAEVDRGLDEVERRLAALDQVAWLAVGQDYRTIYFQVSTASNAELTATLNAHVRPLEHVTRLTTNVHLRNWSPVFTFSGSPAVRRHDADRILWRSGEYPARPIDDVDAELLACLAEDARMTVTAMTERTGLSVPATRQRLVRLLKDEVVRIRTRPDPLSAAIRAVRVVMQVTRDSTAVAEQLAALPNITYVTESTGTTAMQLEMTCATEAQVADVYRRVGSVEGVHQPRLVRYSRVRTHTGRW
jgi:Lrp/AsnC family transcriptional regulator for asnA, asnC and gidA